MSISRRPDCLSCKFFKGSPSKPGQNAKCSVKSKGAPRSIYFDGKPCNQYAPKR